MEVLEGSGAPRYKRRMGDSLMAVAVFLAGAISGALLKYLQDRHLLQLYGELVEQLSRGLRQPIQILRRGDPEVEARLLAELAGKARAGSLS